MLAVALAAACGGEASAGDRTVVASVYPVAYAAGEIAGPTATVDDLTPPGAEPHDVELSPRDVERLQAADVVFYLGESFQPAVEDAVDGASGRAIDLLAPGDGRDPHVWLDPLRFETMARRIGAVLGRERQARAFVRRLDELDRDYRRGLASCARRDIVTSHAAFGRLADRYGLRQIPLTGIEPEAEASAGAIERLVDQVRASGATTVFVEPLVAPDLADTVASEAGVGVATLDPLEAAPPEGAYFGAMRANLAALRRALGCR